MKAGRYWELFLVFGTLLVASCGGPGSSSNPTISTSPITSNVQVTWIANRERAVNQAGGGYTVYYSSSPGFNIVAASSVNVPYVSGPAAPTSATISSLSTGAYYIKVVAYSILNPPGSSSGSTSIPSAEISITVP